MKCKLFKVVVLSTVISVGILGCRSKDEPTKVAQEQKLSKIPEPGPGPKETGGVVQDTQFIVRATLDEVSNNQISTAIQQKSNDGFQPYSYHVQHDQYDNWSEKLFGRCCTEADMVYAEYLSFKVTSDVKNEKYPVSNLMDTDYLTAYVFKENQSPKIQISLDFQNSYSENFPELAPGKILKENDTLLYPFKISMINGYVKSKSTFENNGRVKTLQVFLNDTHMGMILLQDIPSVQQFSMDFPFKRNDRVTLVPKAVYSGEKYDDICISEIQSSLGNIAYPALNKKYTKD